MLKWPSKVEGLTFACGDPFLGCVFVPVRLRGGRLACILVPGGYLLRRTRICEALNLSVGGKWNHLYHPGLRPGWCAIALQVLLVHSIHHTIVREFGGIHLFMVQSTWKSQMDFSRAQKYLRPGWWWGDGSCREKLLSVFHENVYPNKRIYSYHFGLFGGLSRSQSIWGPVTGPMWRDSPNMSGFFYPGIAGKNLSPVKYSFKIEKTCSMP